MSNRMDFNRPGRSRKAGEGRTIPYSHGEMIPASHVQPFITLWETMRVESTLRELCKKTGVSSGVIHKMGLKRLSRTNAHKIKDAYDEWKKESSG